MTTLSVAIGEPLSQYVAIGGGLDPAAASGWRSLFFFLHFVFLVMCILDV